MTISVTVSAAYTDAQEDLDPVLSSFDDNLLDDPPTLQINSLRDGTLYWDFHSSATPPEQGGGDIGSGSTAVVGGVQEVLIDLEAYPNETGYLHIRITNGNGDSNVLTTRQITTMPTFDPADLFGASDKGFILDPSQFATLFYKDTIKTDTVDADGDSIALIVDAAGKTADLSQSTAGNRPLYKTGGGLHWVLTDTTDRFALPADFLDHTKDWTIVFAVSLESDANGGLWGSHANGGGTSIFWNGTGGSRKLTYVLDQAPNTDVGDFDSTAAVVSTPYIYTFEWTRSTGTLTYRKNGVLIDTVVASTATDIAATTAYYLFNYTPFSAGAVAKHYYNFFIDRALGYSERINLEHWAAAKAGITPTWP